MQHNEGIPHLNGFRSTHEVCHCTIHRKHHEVFLTLYIPIGFYFKILSVDKVNGSGEGGEDSCLGSLGQNTQMDPPF